MNREEVLKKFTYHESKAKEYKIMLKTKFGFEGLCTKGHELANNVNKNGFCKTCHKILMKNYAESDKGKLARARALDKYYSSPGYRKHKKKNQERYSHSKSYVAHLLGLELKDLTDELYLLKLTTLNLDREMEKQNVHNTDRKY